MDERTEILINHVDRVRHTLDELAEEDRSDELWTCRRYLESLRRALKEDNINHLRASNKEIKNEDIT